ncbi:MAG: VCBS repeat-containing protein [Steroidobacteraceae bacterium]
MPGGDGRVDLLHASTSEDADRVGLYLGLQDANLPGTFLPAIKLAAGQKPRQVAVADLDGDDRPDLAVGTMVSGLVNDYESVVQLYLQDPAQPGHFVRGGRYDSGDLAEFIAVADLDGDGLPDVVTGEGPQVLYNDATRPGTLLDTVAVR